MSFAQMEIILLKEGYRPGAPSAEATKIDRMIASRSICNSCHIQGMEYAPYSKEGSYRAFAICPRCKYFIEF